MKSEQAKADTTPAGYQTRRDDSTQGRVRRGRQSVVLLLCGALIACGSDDTTAEAPAAPLRPVKVLEASADGAARERVLSATVISADSQDLSFRVGGIITSLPVDVGDRVGEGELVAALDQRPFQLGVQEARAQLSQAEANDRNAESQYQRTRELYSTEATSLSELENAKASASSASANRSVAQEGLNSAQDNLDYTQLLSPSANCQVVSVPAALNQNVGAGQTIATTACGDQLRLRSVIPESLINQISVGMPATATLQSGKTALSGKVVEVAVSNNGSTGYLVEIELVSPPPAVKVGMAARVTFSLMGGDERLLIPLIAVMSDGEERFVYVAEPEEDHYRIARQAVQIGELDNEGVEILQGLEPGQRVVVAGMSRISEGMNVALYAGVEE